ncbi:hypothetical protein R1flu_014875 [Riccia fluitans]|uniref:Uncharacterized protein n=1 Tax=Riccia fluitans TaxID=41844 RepID=A0ABD1YKP9_9MARC
MDEEGRNGQPETEEDGRNEHCKAFGDNLRRITEVISSMPPSHEFSLILEEVVNLIRGFKIIGRSYVDQLVMNVHEVNNLKMKKQMVEKKLETLQSQVSRVFLRQPLVLQDASKLDLVKPRSAKAEQQIKNGDSRKDVLLEVILHRNILYEEKLKQRERELAKLREAYTKLSTDLLECRKENSRLGTRLREIEEQETKKVQERKELSKTRTLEISELKDDRTRLGVGTARLGKEACVREEQIWMTTSKNERVLAILKSDPKVKDDLQLKREHKMLRMYLRYLSSRFLSAKGSEDLQIELRGLDCRGFDAETTSYLRTILETGLKAWQQHVREERSESTGGLHLVIQSIKRDTEAQRVKHPKKFV